MKILIVAILFFVNSLAFSQAKVWVKFGDEALEEGDNYSASKFYLKAFAEDSTYEALVFKLGLSFKGYHNYKKALVYFKRIEKSPELKLVHPTCQFHIAEIYKNIGDYDKSVLFFKNYTRNNGVNTRSFEYLKAKNELKNYDKVQLLLQDTVDVEIKNLGFEINTGAAEYYPVWLSDSTILYSALKTNKISNEGVVEDENYLVRIYSGILKDSIWQSDEVIDSKKSTINKSYTDGCIDNNELGVFYFSKENSEGNYQIVKTKFTAIEGKSQSGTQLKMDSIVSVVFSHDDYLYSYRNPFVINVNNKKYMLFASDRRGGRGKMDLWYSEFKRGVWGTPKNLGNKVNSPGNEVGPNYNLQTFKFHFASDWHYNLGGFDVFEAIGFWKRPTSVINKGIPINSRANDLYYAPRGFFKGMFTSARAGTTTDKDAVCCNDLYSFAYPVPQPPKIDTTILASKEEVLLRLQKMVEEYHVTLYFHNDRPNPNNWDTITPLTYLESYEGYLDSMPTYYIENSLGLHGEDSVKGCKHIQDFFDDYVHKGVEDLRVFLDELIKELDSGSKIQLSVKGYASPLAKSNYNVNLTLRRINSLENYLERHPSGRFGNYLNGTAKNGGLLKIVKIPCGENRSDTVVSDDYYNTRHSVYSKEASLERKIEIINLTLIEDLGPKMNYEINLDSAITSYDLGVLDTNEFSWRFNLVNRSDSLLKIVGIDPGCHCLKPKRKSLKIESKEIEPLDIDFDLKGYSGKLGRKIELTLANGEKRILILYMELKLQID